jgi:O-antigen/teichoic acid export membrane protein
VTSVVTDPSGTPVVPDGEGVPASAASSAEPSIRSVLTRGSIWVTVGYGGSQVIRLGGNLILWRLLNPTAFGIMAIVNVLMQGLQMFSDVGIGPSIIQNERGDDPVYLNTAWTIQAARGFVLFLVSVVVAVPAARFYGEPLMTSMLPVVGLGAAISGFNSTSLFTVVRKVALGRVTFIELASQAGGLVVMIVIAYIYRTIWGIVIGGLVSNALRMLLGHVALPGVRNRLAWDPACARTLMRFGRWIFLSTLLTFAVGQSDRLIFGKIIPISLLGVYSIATVWANLPTTILDRVFSSVLFPILSRFESVGDEFSKAFRQTRTPALLVAGWMTASVIAGGPVLIRFLYDQRAVDAGWIVQSLSIGTWLLALETTNSTALLARGKANWLAIGSAAKLLGMFVAIPVGFITAGFPGAVFGYSVSELLRYITSVAGAVSINLRSYRQDLLLSACLAVTAVAGLAVGKGVHHLLAPLAASHSRPEALLEGLAIMAVVGLGWLAMYRGRLSRRRS